MDIVNAFGVVRFVPYQSYRRITSLSDLIPGEVIVEYGRPETKHRTHRFFIDRGSDWMDLHYAAPTNHSIYWVKHKGDDFYAMGRLEVEIRGSFVQSMTDRDKVSMSLNQPTLFKLSHEFKEYLDAHPLPNDISKRPKVVPFRPRNGR